MTPNPSSNKKEEKCIKTNIYKWIRKEQNDMTKNNKIVLTIFQYTSPDDHDNISTGVPGDYPASHPISTATQPNSTCIRAD